MTTATTTLRKKLRSFAGGVHPHDDGKALSRMCVIEPAPAGSEYIIFLSQHIGAPCAPTVKKKDEVQRGQVIVEAQGFVSAPIHAPVTGTVTAVEPRPHPIQARAVPAVVLAPAAAPESDAAPADKAALDSLDADQIKQAILEAGIVGMGGATFPTHVKLSPPPDKPVDVLLLNGAECEPYITADYRLMVEKPAEVVAGMRFIMKALGVDRGIVGIEANKLDAAEAMAEAAEPHGIDVEICKVRYPQGAEHQLIKALTGRTVRGSALPMEVGVVVQNIATAYAIYEACSFGKPLVERVVTVTGDGVESPHNFLTPIGTPIQVLLDAAGVKEQANKVILGGPMMGFAVACVEGTPTMKGTNSVLVLANAEQWAHRACIRCGKCVVNCPYGLNPSAFSVLCEAKRFEETLALNVMDCKECGCCTWGCPARRPIVQYVRSAKAWIAKNKPKK